MNISSKIHIAGHRGLVGSALMNLPDEKYHGEPNMKVVILAGGLGTRISEETHLKPKPMIEDQVQGIVLN